VAGVGDVDGDRRDDFAVGAARANGLAGRAYLFSGRTRALLRTFDGETAGDLFGAGIARTGDLDGDRRGDLIVGAPDAGPGQPGRAYVLSGASGRRILPPLAPAASGGDFGWFFVATPGDVDGDGTNDLYVGDFSDSGDSPFSGRAARAASGTRPGSTTPEASPSSRAGWTPPAIWSSSGWPCPATATPLYGA
jgi:FG-GAP repeat